MDGFAPWIGIWGGILSTVLASLQLRNWWLERGSLRLRLDVTPGALAPLMGAGQPRREPYAVLMIANTGRTNAFIRRVGARRGTGWQRLWRPIEPVFRDDFESPRELGVEGHESPLRP